MASLFTKLFGRNARKMSPSRCIRKDRVRLGVERLESRELLSSTPITDMTQWARATVKPASTYLYLDFDGNGSNIKAFQPRAGQSRDVTIQDIIYRVSEIFSPFNVTVVRLQGPNNYPTGYPTSGGYTTIFIGGDTNNVKRDASTGQWQKYTAGFTPSRFSDYPTSSDWGSHVLHSNPYNLAYVDPMAASKELATQAAAQNPSKWDSVQPDDQIAQGIAHEAGHTYGLAHVWSTTLPDAMNYNVPTPGFKYFVNQTFKETNLNYDPIKGLTNPDPRLQPYSHYEPALNEPWFSLPAAITTQNSFTYLETLFGDRGADSTRHWSDPNTVDPSSHNNAAPTAIGPGTNLNWGLGNTGYAVYKLSVPTTQQVHVNVQPQSQMYPVLMVHDSTGNSLPFFAIGRSTYDNAQVDFQANGGQTYYVIVGSKDSLVLSGFYNLTVTANAPVPNLTGAKFTFTPTINTSWVIGTLRVLSEDVNTGQFMATYTNLNGTTFLAQGIVSGTRTAGGITTSSIDWSVLMGTFYAPQFHGTLTGTGNARPGGWHDTIVGLDADFTASVPWVLGRDF